MSHEEIMIIRRNYRYDKPELEEPELYSYKKGNESDIIGRLECHIPKD